jgi:hypothetical protein
VLSNQLLEEIQNGEAEPLARAARRIPSARLGRPVTLSCLVRWISRGVLGPDGQRVYLEAARLGGKWITTPAALSRFVERQTPATTDQRQPTAPASPVRRQRAAELAGRQLEFLGVN